MPFRLQKNRNSLFKILIPAILVLFTLSCATIVSPTGGAKDITPPKMISSLPKNYSTNFHGNKIILTFDEYITLKTPEKYLLISPPLSKTPDIKVKGHSIVIKIADSLKSNTTYNFYLGDAVVDITESNPVPNFNFAFSTGAQIDSMSLLGNVTDAFTRMPAKEVWVMLYKDFTDSIPMKRIPEYVSRTSEKGDFRLNSLAAGKYRAIALKDGNSDYIYNLPTEMIGFSSDSVQAFYVTAESSDSNLRKQETIDEKLLVAINLFSEPDSTQRILKSALVSKNRISIAFRYPMKKPGFRALNVADSLPWALQEWNHSNDTLHAWLLNKPDTLKLEISEKGNIFDTIAIPTQLKSASKSKNADVITRLGYTTSVTNGLLEYRNPFTISFINPVNKHTLGALKLTGILGKDTTAVIPQLKFTDSLQRHMLVSYDWIPGTKYDLLIPKGSFIDMYGDSCNLSHVVFQMRPIDDYGKFAVNIKRQDQSTPVIIQLITEKGAVVAQQSVTTNRNVDFGLLAPAKYGLKAIMDKNSNGRWDTGKFIKKIQPETVLVHPKIFEVRTNWELEEIWEL